MKITPMSDPRKGQACICVECSRMIYADREAILCDLEGVPFKAYYHKSCLPVFTMWEFLEEKSGYFFWKYDDQRERTVYNVTKSPKPPKTDGGYYSYGYLLKVKGLLKGDTVTSILNDWAKGE